MVNGYNRPCLLPRCAETLIEHLLLAHSKIRLSRPPNTHVPKIHGFGSTESQLPFFNADGRSDFESMIYLKPLNMTTSLSLERARVTANLLPSGDQA